MRLLLEGRGTEVSLLPAIKQGGEGSIHPVSGEPGIVAKVFSHPTRERSEKLRAMLDNPPIIMGNAPVVLAWPKDRLLNQAGECVGYVMPYVRDKEPLFTVSHPGTRPRWAEHRCLLRAAKNIALAVSAFHRHGYVVGDLNEFNILIGPDASVAVVDTDSIQVRTQHELFRCQVGKPEFTPPELIQIGTSFSDVDRNPHHDAFGLSVLIFLLLMDGNHPFAARYVGNAARQTQTQRIAQGQWPYSTKRNGAYRPRRQAPPLESLSPRIRQLMRDCFEAGHANPTCRPTADDWHRVLDEAEAEWDELGARVRYWYYRVLRPRGWAQNLVVVPEPLRSVAARVPRKVWATVACALVVILLVVVGVRLWNSDESSQDGRNPTNPVFEREVGGEETPWLWKEAQRRNRAGR